MPNMIYAKTEHLVKPYYNESRWKLFLASTTQSRIIGAVRGAPFQLWGTITPVCSLYAARKYDRRFGTPVIV